MQCPLLPLKHVTSTGDSERGARSRKKSRIDKMPRDETPASRPLLNGVPSKVSSFAPFAGSAAADAAAARCAAAFSRRRRLFRCLTPSLPFLPLRQDAVERGGRGFAPPPPPLKLSGALAVAPEAASSPSLSEEEERSESEMERSLRPCMLLGGADALLSCTCAQYPRNVACDTAQKTKRKHQLAICMLAARSAIPCCVARAAVVHVHATLKGWQHPRDKPQQTHAP